MEYTCPSPVRHRERRYGRAAGVVAGAAMKALAVDLTLSVIAVGCIVALMAMALGQ
jgi:hypothetical protein